MSKRSAIGRCPFSLTHGQDTILPMEVVILFLRIGKQNGLTLEEYNETMIIELVLMYDITL